MTLTKDKKKLMGNMFFLLFVQLSNYLAPILVLPFLTRILAIDGFGLIVLSLSIISISLIITDYGFGLSAAYWISINRSKVERVSFYIGAVFGAKLLIFLFVLVFFSVYYFLLDTNYDSKISYYVIILLIIFFQSFQAVWFFQGIEKMKNISLITLLSKLLYIVLIFCFVHHADDTQLVLMCLLFSYILSSFLTFIFINKEGYSVKMPNFRMCYKILKQSSEFFFSRIAVGLYTSANVFIIGTISGLHQAAIYSCAEKLYQAGQGVCLPVSQALYPHLAKSKDYKQLFNFILVLLIPLSLGISVVMLFSNEIIVFIYGEKFSSASNILNVFLICIVINFIGVNVGYPLFSTINKLKMVNYTVYVAGVVQLGILFFLYINNNIFGINIAYSVLFVEFLVLVLRLGLFFYYKKGIANVI